MNRYFYYLIIVNMVANIVACVPRILLEARTLDILDFIISIESFTLGFSRVIPCGWSSALLNAFYSFF
ncbi:hypothetical protein [Ectobacillus funiculus]|uniref:hypothetical protein n=1 Tax=Ectobacillus funiculus TaxID=137993 RepID=UPI00101D4835|nr:hypothetical protein [Ectobacillus funiculus]